eukprot:s990_g9.t1
MLLDLLLRRRLRLLDGLDLLLRRWLRLLVSSGRSLRLRSLLDDDAAGAGSLSSSSRPPAFGLGGDSSLVATSLDAEASCGFSGGTCGFPFGVVEIVSSGPNFEILGDPAVATSELSLGGTSGGGGGTPGGLGGGAVAPPTSPGTPTGAG